MSYFQWSILQWGPGSGTIQLNCRPPKVGWCTEPSPVWLMPPPTPWALAAGAGGARPGMDASWVRAEGVFPDPIPTPAIHPRARLPTSARHRSLGSLCAFAAARSKDPKPVHTVPTLDRGVRAWIMDRGGSVASEFKLLPIFSPRPVSLILVSEVLTLADFFWLTPNSHQHPAGGVKRIFTGVISYTVDIRFSNHSSFIIQKIAR